MDPIFAALETDVRRLESRLPRELACLARVAWNLAWSWLPDGQAFFRDLDAGLWEAAGHSPRAMLEWLPRTRLAEIACDPVLLRRALELSRGLEDYLAQPAAPEVAGLAEGGVAYFSAEYGIHESIPIYAGGLGVLAGDHLKSASDLGLPLVGVGLRYRQGYFRQVLDRSGWQHEEYQDTPFGQLPLGLILKPDGTPEVVQTPFRGRKVTLQLWGAMVGRTPLLLLDSDRDDNEEVDRWITGHLYGGDHDTRLSQELVLGIGGVRALRLLGYRPAVFHMNEGHAAFLTLELLREHLAEGLEFPAALEAVRRSCVFTTHTPVPAGHDVFRHEHLAHCLQGFLAELTGPAGPIHADQILELGRRDPEDPYEDFGMTPLAMRLSRSINGVSKLHGEVCRRMWSCLWPGRAVDEIPIGHVTNGVHPQTWIAPILWELLDRHFTEAHGADWIRRISEPEVWEAVQDIPDEELWQVHGRLKQLLTQHARSAARKFREALGEDREYVEAADRLFDPEALTVGFARRVATYKRLDLLLEQPERALNLLADPDRPIQFVISGKAHPGDSEAKRLLQYLFRVRFDPRVLRRATFIVNYDIAVARSLVRGCDVWLNLPRRPLEASGTSGMKAAMNGVLNCSILDGWWAEGYTGRNGWAVGRPAEYTDVEEQDADDAASLYRILEGEVIPLYYDRDDQGIPRQWVSMMKEAIRNAGPRFSSTRMVSEYAGRIYAP